MRNNYQERKMKTNRASCVTASSRDITMLLTLGQETE